MTRIAVLGAAGFLGRALVARLAEDGNEVIAGTRSGTPVPGAYAQIRDGFDTVESYEALIAGCDVVINTASISTPGTSARRPLREIEESLRVTGALIEALQKNTGTRLLQISSGGAVYADASSGAPSNESAPVRPRSYHGAAKLAAEWFISAWCDQCHAQAVVIRPSNIYGRGQPARAGFGIIPAAFNALKNAEPLSIWGNGSAARDYIHVEDVVALSVAALAMPAKPGMTLLNACSGESVSLNALLALIGEVAGVEVPRIHEAGRHVDAPNIAMDNSLAGALLGWQPRITLREGLADAWAAVNKSAPRDA